MTAREAGVSFQDHDPFRSNANRKLFPLFKERAPTRRDMMHRNVREQRSAPRYETACVAELAVGTAIARVLVLNMSVYGCGVEVVEPICDLPMERDLIGLLNVELFKPRYTTMLPVRICNTSAENQKLRFGLKFCGVSPREMNSILGLMEIIVVPSAGSA